MIEKIKIKLDPEAYVPERAHKQDAGLDLFTPYRFILPGNDTMTIDTGVHVEIPEGYVGFLKSKSGLNVRYSITSEGVIDAGYTGSIKVKLYNNNKRDHVFLEGDKISQLVILPILTPEIELVESLDETERGNNGFGSTGR